jgi:hypothetical protein
LLVNSSGAARVTVTPLLDPSIVAGGGGGSYTPPGQ